MHNQYLEWPRGVLPRVAGHHQAEAEVVKTAMEIVAMVDTIRNKEIGLLGKTFARGVENLFLDFVDHHTNAMMII